MDMMDGLQLSLLDTGLTTQQIERVQELVTEAGNEMMAGLLCRFLEEGFTTEQVGAIIKNIFGFIVKDEYCEIANRDVDEMFENPEE